MKNETSAEEWQTEGELTKKQGVASTLAFLALVGSGTCMWQLHLGWWGIGAVVLLSFSCSCAAQSHDFNMCKIIFRILYALGRLIEE